MKYQKGEGTAEIFGGIISLIFFGWLVYLGVTSYDGFGEREGLVRYSDCREQIPIKEDNIHTFYQSFTCSYNKTQSGKIMSGTCVHIDYANNSNECKVAFIYAKKQAKVCSKDFPILGPDDKCYKED
jgi:hypothetical protein